MFSLLKVFENYLSTSLAVLNIKIIILEDKFFRKNFSTFLNFPPAGSFNSVVQLFDLYLTFRVFSKEQVTRKLFKRTKKNTNFGRYTSYGVFTSLWCVVLGTISLYRVGLFMQPFSLSGILYIIGLPQNSVCAHTHTHIREMERKPLCPLNTLYYGEGDDGGGNVLWWRKREKKKKGHTGKKGDAARRILLLREKREQFLF